MTLLLLLLAATAALNPLRAAAVTPRASADRRPAVALGAAVVAVATVGVAAVSGPIVDGIGLSGSSARIAAGVALAITALRDVFVSSASPEPALSGSSAGLVPLAFPTLFTPAVAFLAVAAGHERGVAIAAIGLLVPLALASAVAASVGPGGGHRRGIATVGLAGVGIGALVTLDGIYAI